MTQHPPPIQARRFLKWVLFLIVIGCIAVADFFAIPSLSKYALLLDGGSTTVVGRNTTASHYLHGRNKTESSSSSSITTGTKYPAQIDLVSLTVHDDFFVLFNNSAVTSWIRHIKNIRSIIFIGRPTDYPLFSHNMQIHYPHLANGTIPIQWVNETHWIETYKDKFHCPYHAACQQLIKFHVFDLRSHLGVNVSESVLIIDSDTVWSRDVEFVNPNNGQITYFGYNERKDCIGMDPIDFTEAITAGTPPTPPESAIFPPSTPSFTKTDSMKYWRELQDFRTANTATPYKSCLRESYPNSTGVRHIAHHMLFQYDVMSHLHRTINNAWDTPSVWNAFVICQGIEGYCASRIAEYELYYSFVSEHYPERVHLEVLTDAVDIVLGSAICDEEEMKCCRKQGVLLKGCHDHRLKKYNADSSEVGGMCCKHVV